MSQRTEGGLVIAVVIAGLGGCLGPVPNDTSGFNGMSGSAPPAGSDEGTGTGGLGAGATGGGLPCDIEAFLVAECVACHSAAVGTPPLLESYDDLLAPYGASTAAEASLLTMKDAQDPMPPTGLPPSADVAMFEAWIAEGTPPGDCGSQGAGGAGPTPFDGEVVCTTDEYWTDGTKGSGSMTPGQACIACHTAEDEGPKYVVAGTAYRTGHEPDDCFGASDAIVEIIGADGAVTTLTTNGAGNFSKGGGDIVFPVTARVITDAGVMEKKVPVSQGDCNACHTEAGANGAPGRIVAL